VTWVLLALRKYAVFRGRSSRSEFWFFMLFMALGMFVLSLVDGMLDTHIGRGDHGLFSTIFMLALIVPSLAVGARRLHDIGKSGWWQLINFVPVVGLIVLIFFFTQSGEPRTNQYGPNPKGAAA
jgi:uncharacterized membrane protein YhaH (DUF805 family)